MTDSGWPRKHGRLESFLQKLLASEASRVTWYEPCILDGGPAKKPSYCFVVLTDGHMYLIDNPPKQVKFVVALGDIVDLQLVHESPMFLKGEERENVQNIKISCRTRPRLYSENMLRSLSRFPATPSRATSRSSSVLSEAFTVPSSPSKDSERKHRRLRKFLMSLSWPKKKTLIHRLGNDLELASPVASKDFSETSSLSSSISQGESSIPSRLSFSRLLPLMHLVDGGTVTLDPVLGSLDSSGGSDPQTVSSFLNVDAPREWVNMKRPATAFPDMSQVETTSLGSNCNSDISEMTVRSEPIGRSRTVLGNYADHRSRPTSAMMRSISDTTTTQSTGQLINREEELNLYILKPLSGFFKHLKAAWTSCLLKETLDLDEARNINCKTESSEHIERMLQELQRKLCLYSDNNFAQIRQLSDRIQKDIERCPSAKKAFWKDLHIFPALVNKLQTLVLSSTSLEHHTIGYVMDKIKACSSLVNILASVLQESVYCPGRPKHLTYRSGQRTKNLLTMLVTTPWIPPAYRETTMATVTSFAHFSTREWENLMEAPLIRSIAELTNASTMALYQYFQLALEGHELMSYQYTYGIGWMVKIISEVKSVDTFVSRLMCQLLLLTSATDHCPLTPAQAVLLHQQVSILSTFVSSSPHFALQIAIMFGEDIRYFVLRQVIEKKVLPHYPIRASLLSSVESLRQTVLQKRTTVSTATRLISVDHPLWFKN